MRMDVIMAERSRVRSALACLDRAIKSHEALSAVGASEKSVADDLARLRYEYEQLTGRLTFIDDAERRRLEGKARV
jgi:hypothetical protein